MGNLNSASQWQHRTLSCGVNDAILHKPNKSYCACTAVLTITSKTPGEFLQFSSQTAFMHLPWQWSYSVLLLAAVSNSGDVKTHLGRQNIDCMSAMQQGGYMPRYDDTTKYLVSFCTFHLKQLACYLHWEWSYSVSLLAAFIQPPSIINLDRLKISFQ